VIFNNEMNLNVALAFNIAIGLVAGKSIGITILSFLGVKLGLAELPEGINFKQIIGIAFLAGVGFTMSIYIANLAFDNNPVFLSSAKVGIFIGSIISGLIGYLILLFTGKR